MRDSSGPLTKRAALGRDKDSGIICVNAIAAAGELAAVLSYSSEEMKSIKSGRHGFQCLTSPDGEVGRPCGQFLSAAIDSGLLFKRRFAYAETF